MLHCLGSFWLADAWLSRCEVLHTQCSHITNFFGICAMWATPLVLLRLHPLCAQVQQCLLDSPGRCTRPDEFHRGLAAGQVTQLNTAGAPCTLLAFSHTACCWPTPPIQIVKVSRIINHDGFNSRTKENDVSLLKLQKPLTFNEWVRPIEICSAALPTDRNCTITGWGSTRESEWEWNRIDCLHNIVKKYLE